MEEKESGKRKIWIIVFIIALAVAVAAALYVARTIYQSRHEQVVYENILDEVANAAYDEREGEAATLPNDIYTEQLNPIDFEKLKSYNKELIAWVRVPNTVIDYPVARHENDADVDYYLYHDMYQEPAYAGCIYVDYANSGDFSDYNTVLYGHNMANDTMFGSLHDFEDEKFFKKN